MLKKTLEYFIGRNLQYRPRFFAYIRSQEAFLFTHYAHHLKHRILDFGCGDGFFAETVFGKGAIDIGLDVPTSRMKQAISRAVYKKTVEYDGVRIPFASSSIGSIVSNCVFEHIPHIEKSIAEMYRVLRPGGHLLTSVMCTTWNKNLSGKKWGGNAYVSWFNSVQEHNCLLSKQKWSALFKKSGFSLVASDDYLFERASVETERYHFLSISSLMRYRLTGKWTSGKPASAEEIRTIASLIQSDNKNPSACFFVLKKPLR
jgi:ubiquinone/menaquinone biosynthesis C-methylase UbiE